MFLKVKRFKHIEDLLAEANLIRIGSGEPDADTGTDTSQYKQTAEDLRQWDIFLDSMIDKVINADAWKEEDIIKSKSNVEEYLDYCKKRLSRITELIKETLTKKGPDHKKTLKSLTDQHTAIAKRISLLDELYTKIKVRESQQIKQIAEEISAKIKAAQDALKDSYMIIIQDAAKQNQNNLTDLTTASTQQQKEEAATEILSDWVIIEEVTEDFTDEDKDELNRAKTYTEDKIKEEIGEERLTALKSERPYTREELKVLERIIKLKYTDFTTEKELTDEIKQIRAKINALQGQSKEDTIRELTKLLDMAEISLLAKLKNKEIELNRTKGIHFDLNKRLKLYERVSIPVTGKQIADDTALMKFRKGLTSLMDLLLGSAARPMTPAGEAFANFGAMVHKIYAKTLNKTAKVVGKALKGREGEMKGDALSRLFIPDTSVVDDKPAAAFEEAGSAPGVAIQVPGSIGGMGAIVAPTATTLGSGDNFNPVKKKKKKKTTHILEFADFLKNNNL